MLPPLPCISLYQPYASLIFAPEPFRKVHETRHWPYPERLQGCMIAIHAGMKMAPRKWVSRFLADTCEQAFGENWRKSLPHGAILGVVRLEACLPTATTAAASAHDLRAGDWTAGRVAWRLADVRELVEPLPMRGRQGFWKVPQDDFRYAE